MDQQRIAQCVEILCQQGCTEVRSTIVRIESGADIPQTEGLSSEEILAVLEELKAIMAVYDQQ